MFPWKWEFTGVRSCITLLLQCLFQIEEMPFPSPQSWAGIPCIILARGVETEVLAPSWMTNCWLHKVWLESTIGWIQGGVITCVSSPEAKIMHGIPATKSLQRERRCTHLSLLFCPRISNSLFAKWVSWAHPKLLDKYYLGTLGTSLNCCF